MLRPVEEGVEGGIYQRLSRHYNITLVRSTMNRLIMDSSRHVAGARVSEVERLDGANSHCIEASRSPL
jgi:hypothetical protein